MVEANILITALAPNELTRATLDSLQGTAEEEVVDTLVLTDEKSIKIEQVRDLQVELATPALAGRHRRVVIGPLERMGVPAQQALLKLAEEPPVNTEIFLIAASLESVLPTLRSRCAVHTLGSETPSTHGQELWEKLWKANSPKERWEVISSLPTLREEAVALIGQAVTHGMRTSAEQEGEKRYRILQALEMCWRGLRANVTPSLCFHTLVLE